MTTAEYLALVLLVILMWVVGRPHCKELRRLDRASKAARSATK